MGNYSLSSVDLSLIMVVNCLHCKIYLRDEVPGNAIYNGLLFIRGFFRFEPSPGLHIKGFYKAAKGSGLGKIVASLNI
jgi:hypothetical protein